MKVIERADDPERFADMVDQEKNVLKNATKGALAICSIKRFTEEVDGGDYSDGGGGAYQFALGTWEGLTGLSTPAQDSPPAVQDAAALTLFSQRGWEPWTTRYVCGL